MNRHLVQQIDLLRSEEKLELLEFESLLNEAESNDIYPSFTVYTIEKWANGRYVKLASSNAKFPYNTGELITLIGKIEFSGTVLFDNGSDLVTFTRDKIDVLSPGDKLRIINGSKNTFTFDAQHRAIRRVSKAIGNNRLVTNIIKGRYTQSGGKKLNLKYKLALNQYQIAAVEHAIKSRDFACIFGPPGTGKTTTLSELIYQLVLMDETVLVSCPSNVAVDALYSKTITLGVTCVRVGKGAFVKELLLKMSKNQHLTNSNIETSLLSNEQGSYSRRIKLLKNARAVFTTCVGTNSQEIQQFARDNRPFDTLIIDESGNSLESMSYIGLFTGVKRVVFSGDHFQLPPNVKSAVTPMSILERLSISSPMSFAMLKRQYRMNRQIAEWSNKQFYSNQLESDASVINSVLNENMLDLYPPIIWYDIESKEKTEGGSKYNRIEAWQVVDYAKILLSTPGIYPESVTIITPYKAQSRLLHDLIGVNRNRVNISSIDASQGSESDVVILSLVSCNKTGDVGFMADYRRMNVAITRGKRHVAIFGSARTFQLNHQPYKDLVNSVKFGFIWWKFHLDSLAQNHFIAMVDYLIKYYNNSTSTALSPNGYFAQSNLKLAKLCKEGNITHALQHLTPNPVSIVIVALCLLFNNDDLDYSNKIVDDINSNDFYENNVFFEKRLDERTLSQKHYMGTVTNSLASTRAGLDGLITANLNILFSLSLARGKPANVAQAVTSDLTNSSGNLSTIIHENRTSRVKLFSCKATNDAVNEKILKLEAFNVAFNEKFLTLEAINEIASNEKAFNEKAINEINTIVNYDNSAKLIGTGKPNRGKFSKGPDRVQSSASGNNTTLAGKTTNNKKNIKSSKNVNVIENEDDDLDLLLKEFHKCSMNNSKKSNDVTCDKNTSLLGITCKLCKLRFCVKHASPEKHKCKKLKR